VQFYVATNGNINSFVCVILCGKIW